MYVSTQRLFVRTTSVVRCMLWLGLGLALALFAQTGLGQDDPGPVPLLQRPEVFRAQSPYDPGAMRDPGSMRDPSSMRVAPDGAQTQFGDAVQDSLLFGDQLSGRTGEAYGTLFRAGVLTGPAVGRTETIVPLEIMPYGFINNAMVFGSLRGFRAASDGWGMNLGGGIRYYAQRWDRIFGANAFYDYDNSSGGLFREVGFGFESLGTLWDMRANAYIPLATTARLLKTELVDGSQRFVKNNLLYDNLLTNGNALRGVDWELGVPVPGRVPQRHALKLFGGFYYYNGSTTEGFTGWKARAQANVVQNLTVQLEVFNDQVFDTSVVFGATWTYGGFRQADDQKRTQFDRMTEMVRRSYNITVAKIPTLDPGKIAINPLTSKPYFFEHVASYANPVGMNGTVENPWQTLTQAQTALNAIIPVPAQQAGNVIFVHANSIYNTAPDNTVVLIPTVRILGEGNGVIHTVPISGLGNVPLPRATNFPNRPIFSNQVGNAVTLVSGTAAAPSEFSGFQIGDPLVGSSGSTGIGIFGDGVANVVVNQTNVNFAQGDGVFLNNMTGPVSMLGTVINNIGNVNPAIDGLHIVGGTGKFSFGIEPFTSKRGVINNTGGYSLEVDGTARGSSINLTGSDINDGTLPTATGQRGGGILLNDIDGVVFIDNATIVNTLTDAFTTGHGIDIEGTAATALTPARGLGQITFLGGIAIDNPAGDGIHIQNMQATPTGTPSSVRFILPNPINGTLQPGIRITNRNAGGITMLNNNGNISFLEPVSIQTSGLPVAAAIDFEGNAGSASFLSITPSSSPNQIQITNGGGIGIRIGQAVPNTGAFRVTGTTSITGIAQESLLVANNAGPVAFDNVNIDFRGQRGIAIQNNLRSVTFTGTTRIDNSSNALFSAVDINNNLIDPIDNTLSGSVSFATLSITNAQAGAGVGAGLNVVNNPPSVSVRTLNVTNPSATVGGIALFADNAGVQPAVITSATADPTLGLSIGSGTLDAFGREAINVQNSVIGLQFVSVSSTNSVAEGILLANNVGPGSTVETDGTTTHPIIFTIRGTPLVPGSGGTIQGAALNGASFQNTEGVSITNADFTGNGGSGIIATTPELDLFNISSTGNGVNGVRIDARATPPVANSVGPKLQTTSPIFTMYGSSVNTNTDSEVVFNALSKGTYNVTLGTATNGNIITDVTGGAVPAAIVVEHVGAAINSTLNLRVVGNTITVATLVGLDGLNVNWNGNIVGAADLNTFNFGVDLDRAIVLNLPSTTATSNFEIMSNVFNSPAGITTEGIDITTGGGQSAITIGRLNGQLNGNVMTFASPLINNAVNANIGMAFSLGANSNVNVFDNQINMTNDAGQGMQFTLVQGPSSLNINNNRINISPLNGLITIERGINILSTTGAVQLFGTINNTVIIRNQQGAGIPYFFAPIGSVTGSILVNGFTQP